MGSCNLKESCISVWRYKVFETHHGTRTLRVPQTVKLRASVLPPPRAKRTQPGRACGVVQHWHAGWACRYPSGGGTTAACSEQFLYVAKKNISCSCQPICTPVCGLQTRRPSGDKHNALHHLCRPASAGWKYGSSNAKTIKRARHRPSKEPSLSMDRRVASSPFHRIQGNSLPFCEVKLTRAKLCAKPLTKPKAKVSMV